MLLPVASGSFPYYCTEQPIGTATIRDVVICKLFVACDLLIFIFKPMNL